jgi:hypothetical protein
MCVHCAGDVYGDGPYIEVTGKCSACNGNRLRYSGDPGDATVPVLQPDSEASLPYDSQSSCPKPWEQVCCGTFKYFPFDMITYA